MYTVQAQPNGNFEPEETTMQRPSAAFRDVAQCALHIYVNTLCVELRAHGVLRYVFGIDAYATSQIT